MIIHPGKFKVLKRVTKKWSSGITTLAVLGNNEHPDLNYIILDRKLLGRPGKNQFFNLHFEDWTKLKEVVEGDTADDHQWPIEKQAISESEALQKVNEILGKDPDFLAKVLANPHISKLTSASFEALDRLGIRIYEIKAQNVEFLLKKLSEAKEGELISFVGILNQLKIGQISTIAELVRKKIAIIKLLEKLLLLKDTKEKEIHQLLEKNLWLLSNSYDLIRSDKTLADYLQQNIKIDPVLGERPDLIVKTFLQDEYHVVIVELKRPSIKLHAKHIGQVLEYKGIIQNHNPKIKEIELFLLGYDIDENMPRGLQDLVVDVLENVINRKRHEFDEFLRVLEASKEDEYEIF